MRTSLTSPTDQGIGAIDIALQYHRDYSHSELARIGESVRIVMELALDQPGQDPSMWAEQTINCIGHDAVVAFAQVRGKANYAKLLLDNGLLVSDEELAHRTIDNGLKRPERIF